MKRSILRGYCLTLGLTLLLASGLSGECLAQAQERVEINAQAKTTPFPHFWEQMFGSGRALLSLRESYRNDLRAANALVIVEAQGVS